MAAKHEKRVFQLLKNKENLKFSQIIFSNPNKYSNQFTTKLESSPVIIDEKSLMTKIENIISSDKLLFPGTVFAAIDRKTFLIAAPPGIKNIYIKHFDAHFKIWHPWVVYGIYMVDENTPYVGAIWYALQEPKIYNKTVLFPAFLPNVFYSGMICVHNIYQKTNDSKTNFNLAINTAIEEFWFGTFNDEVYDVKKGIEVLSSWLYEKADQWDEDYESEYNFYSLIDYYTCHNDIASITEIYRILKDKFAQINLAQAAKYFVNNNPQLTTTSNIQKSANDYAIAAFIRNIYSSLKQV